MTPCHGCPSPGTHRGYCKECLDLLRVGYEVFRLKVGKAHPQDLDHSPKEQFPSNEDFGRWAWTEKILLDAQRRYGIEEGRKIESLGSGEAEKAPISPEGVLAVP